MPPKKKIVKVLATSRPAPPEAPSPNIKSKPELLDGSSQNTDEVSMGLAPVCRVGSEISGSMAPVGKVKIGSGGVLPPCVVGFEGAMLTTEIEIGSGSVVLACRVGIGVSGSTMLIAGIEIGSSRVMLTATLGRICGLAIAREAIKRAIGRLMVSCMMSRAQR